MKLQNKKYIIINIILGLSLVFSIIFGTGLLVILFALIICFNTLFGIYFYNDKKVGKFLLGKGILIQSVYYLITAVEIRKTDDVIYIMLPYKHFAVDINQLEYIGRIKSVSVFIIKEHETQYLKFKMYLFASENVAMGVLYSQKCPVLVENGEVKR